jgi:curved DNA-binding protein CbpA
MSSRRNCYDILGLKRNVSADNIRRAYRQLSALFEPGNATLCGLYDEVDARALLGEIRHAYRVLMDPAARREHDAELFPAAMTVDMSVDRAVDDFPVTDEAPDLATPIPHDGHRVSGELVAMDGEQGQRPGDLIRVARVKMGMSLEEIEERTRIAIFTLRCLENDAYADLPPMIYVRGFLQQICVLLRFDGNDVVAEYVRRYGAYCRRRDEGIGG